MRIFNREEQSIAQRINTKGYMTEAAFSPDGKSLYFLKADTYKNYSPIASERPHEFDVYRMNLETKETEQITFEQGYDMSSLAVTPDGKQLMFRTYREHDQLVFHSMEDGNEKSIVPKGDFASKAPMISSPTLSPDGQYVVFTDVATKDENGTFVYEAFRMDLETKQAEQLTSFYEHVTHPVFFHNKDKLMVTVDKNFAGRNPEYSYWQINTDGEERERVTIEIPEETNDN